MSFVSFFRVGFPFMLCSVLFATAYLLLVFRLYRENAADSCLVPPREG